jgi:hypothetical protein
MAQTAPRVSAAVVRDRNRLCRRRRNRVDADFLIRNSSSTRLTGESEEHREITWERIAAE